MNRDMLAAEYQRLQEEIERTGDVSSGCAVLYRRAGSGQ